MRHQPRGDGESVRTDILTRSSLISQGVTVNHHLRLSLTCSESSPAPPVAGRCVSPLAHYFTQEHFKSEFTSGDGRKGESC